MKTSKWKIETTPGGFQTSMIVVKDISGGAMLFGGCDYDLTEHIVNLHNIWVDQQREDVEVPNETG